MARNHGRFVLSRKVLIGIVLVIVALLIFRWKIFQQDGVSLGEPVEVLHLGIENRDTKIALVEPNDSVVPNPEVLGVKTQTTSFRLKSLESLRGLVHISDPGQALRFVRLRTSRDYCYAWGGESSIQEIVSFSQCALPEFADTGRRPARPESGWNGLLSDTAYRIGKFAPPKVVETEGTYQITRWICEYKGLEGNALQQWQEMVTSEGGYQCKVSRSVRPPNLPDTHWYIYGLK